LTYLYFAHLTFNF